jgi:hypothetical protein
MAGYPMQRPRLARTPRRQEGPRRRLYPILWTAKPVKDSAHGAVYVRTADGRSVAITTVPKNENPRKQIGDEFHSLATGKINAWNPGHPDENDVSRRTFSIALSGKPTVKHVKNVPQRPTWTSLANMTTVARSIPS